MCLVASSFALAFTTIVAVLREGRLADMDRPEEVLAGDRLSRIYGFEVAVERLPSGRPVSEPRLDHLRRGVTAGSSIICEDYLRRFCHYPGDGTLGEPRVLHHVDGDR